MSDVVLDKGIYTANVSKVFISEEGYSFPTLNIEFKIQCMHSENNIYITEVIDLDKENNSRIMKLISRYFTFSNSFSDVFYVDALRSFQYLLTINKRSKISESDNMIHQYNIIEDIKFKNRL